MEDSKASATTAGSTATRRTIAPSPGAVLEELEEQGRVREKEDSKVSAGRAVSMVTHGTAAQKELVPREPGRVEEKADGRTKADGVEKGKEFP